jgi:hypothetical protein
MLQELQPGVFACDDQMPCTPGEIGAIWHWVFPATFNRMEREEAAARLVSFSQEAGRWVGVSWNRLVEMMQTDYKELFEYQKAQEHNWREERRALRSNRQHRLRSILTFGIYGRFVKPYEPKFVPVNDYQEIFTGIFSSRGAGFVAEGLTELVEKDLLRQLVEREGQPDELRVFFPTSALIERIMQKRGRPAA